MSDATLQAIRDTLREKFRGMQILDHLDGRGHVFRIERGTRLIHHLFVARELLDARRQTALSTIFDRFEIVRVLEEAGAREVSVSSRGVAVQRVQSPPAAVAPAQRSEPRIVFPMVSPAPAPPAAPPATDISPPDADTEDAAPVEPPTPAPTADPPAAETEVETPVVPPAPAPTATPLVAEPEVDAPIVPPPPAPTPAPPAAQMEVAVPVNATVAPPAAPSDSFAAALGLIRELRQSLEGIDDSLDQRVRTIDDDLARAEASVVDAEGRFQRATEQLTELVAAMDTAVAKARAGLDRVQQRSR